MLLVFAALALIVAVTLIVLGPSGHRPGTAQGSASPTVSAPTNGATSFDPNATPGPPTAQPSPGSSPDTPTPRPHKEFVAHSAEPEQLTGYVWPLRSALITSRFGPRDFGGFVVIDGQPVHDGLDLATRCGDQIRAAHDGTVLYAGRDFDVFLGYRGDAKQIYARLERQGRVNTLPIVVVIDDGNGYRSSYLHLNRADVVAGAVVRAGDVIGAEGATGFATGCHLHYSLIRIDGGWQEVLPRLTRYGYPPFVRERIDPLRVLPWADPNAPQKLQDKANASPTPS